MSAERARLAPAYWFDGSPVPWAARMLSGLYAIATAARRGLYRRGWMRRERLDVPVLVVGNLTVGGGGKTPLTIAIVERLRREGWMPGVATRGYGRDRPSQPVWVEAGTPAPVGGDEPVLVARRTGTPVRADRDRAAAAAALAAAGCDVVVCDDGLQHYRLVRDVEIEVIDGRRRYGNGRLLPAGPLREPVERGAGCDFRILNLPGSGGGDEAGQAGFGEWPMRLHAQRALPLAGGRPRPLAGFAGQRVHAVAGTADPERFFAMLRELGIGVVPHAFADHHRYVASDLQFGSDLPVLMTEKDAVKCAAFVTDRYYSVPVDAELTEGFWIALLERLAQARRDHRG